MKQELQPGLRFQFTYAVPLDRVVPSLLPESPEFQQMPLVLATGYMVGLFEWACIRGINPYLDWPREQSVGIGVNLSHVAATPPGLTLRIEGELLSREGKKLELALSGHDGVELFSRGTHQRYIIDAARFNAKVQEKLTKAGQG